MAFFDDFLYTPSTRSFTATLVFVQMRGVKVVHIWAKFHLHATCNSGVLIFQRFVQQQKVPFQAASGLFYGHNPPKFCQYGVKFLTVMQSNVLHEIFDSFYSTVENWSKLGQKTDFLGNFQRFFMNALLHPMSYAPTFTPIQRPYGDT